MRMNAVGHIILIQLNEIDCYCYLSTHFENRFYLKISSCYFMNNFTYTPDLYLCIPDFHLIGYLFDVIGFYV